MNSAEQAAEVHQVFKAISANKTTIHRSKLKVLLHSIGIEASDDDIRDMCIRMQLPDDRITFEAFLRSLNEEIVKVQAEDELVAVFKGFDHDNDGFISKQELKALLNGIGAKYFKDKDLDRLMREVMPSGVDKLDFPTFQQFVLDKIVDSNVEVATSNG